MRYPWLYATLGAAHRVKLPLLAATMVGFMGEPTPRPATRLCPSTVSQDPPAGAAPACCPVGQPPSHSRPIRIVERQSARGNTADGHQAVRGRPGAAALLGGRVEAHPGTAPGHRRLRRRRCSGAVPVAPPAPPATSAAARAPEPPSAGRRTTGFFWGQAHAAYEYSVSKHTASCGLLPAPAPSSWLPARVGAAALAPTMCGTADLCLPAMEA